MKKTLTAILLALALTLLGLGAWAEGDAFAGVYHDPTDGVTKLRVTPEGDGYAVTLDIYRLVSLDFTARRDGEALRGTALVDEDAAVEVAIVKAEGGLAATILSSQWGLLEPGTEFAFVPGAPDMDPETFAYLFGEVCTGYAGTAGASLKTAGAASALLDAVIYGDAAYCDADRLADCLAAARDTLGEDARAELDGNLAGILSLMEDAFSDYEAVRGQFEDAGVGDGMALSLSNPLARADWDAFRAAWQRVIK